MFRGKEIKKLIAISTFCCLLMIVTLSLYLTISSRNNLREQTDKMKTAMAEEIAGYLQSTYANMGHYLKDYEGIEFGEGMLDKVKTIDVAYGFLADSISKTYNADFVVVFSGDKIITSVSKPNITIPEDIKSLSDEIKDYTILEKLGEAKGTFLVFHKQGAIPGDKVIFSIDNTEQINTINSIYQDEKSRAVNEQIITASILFIILLTFSLIIILFSINHYLNKPISRISSEARAVIGGSSARMETINESSIFANLQRLINSGQTIIGKEGFKNTCSEKTDKHLKQKETKKVAAAWAIITFFIFLTFTVVLLSTSIALLNARTEDILDSVVQEMAEYYSTCYDSTVDFVVKSPDVYIGSEIWDEDSEIDREASLERLVNLIRVVYDCDISMAYIETEESEKYIISLKENVELKEKPTKIGDEISIKEGYYNESDLVIILMNASEYPGFGENQFFYHVIDITERANVLEGLYESGSSSLLKSQIFISVIFLIICIALSPLAMAWAIRRYITRSIIDLDKISVNLMEGNLDNEVIVDEKSGFADIQRLLIKAQELLRSVNDLE